MGTTRKQGAGRRIGIYAGSFDPVHAGHIAFALQALDQAGLDEVVFLPERRPRYKPGVEHFAHRVAMIKRATKHYSRLSVLELADREFTVRRTWPQLQALFAGYELVFVAGSDVVLTMPDWPYAERMLNHCGLAVGVRSGHQADQILHILGGWTAKPHNLEIISSPASDVSSRRIRAALRDGTYTKGLLRSAEQYARREWLYVLPGVLS